MLLSSEQRNFIIYCSLFSTLIVIYIILLLTEFQGMLNLWLQAAAVAERPCVLPVSESSLNPSLKIILIRKIKNTLKSVLIIFSILIFGGRRF